MANATDRKEIVRIDCPACRGRGYAGKNGEEESCEKCGGKGLLEKEVDYQFENSFKYGKEFRRSPEELAEIFEIPVDQVVDAGHSSGE